MKTWQSLSNFLSAILILVFAYTAFSKLLAFDLFIEQLRVQPFINEFTMSLAYLIPSAELTAALLLMFPITRYQGWIVSSCLMVLFTGYVWLVFFNFFDHIPCSCGGILRDLSWGSHLVLNIFLLLISVAGLILETKIYKVNKQPIS